jgi:hypothetical protein
MMLIRSGFKAGYCIVVLHETFTHTSSTYIAAVQQGLKGVIQYQVRELLL